MTVGAQRVAIVTPDGADGSKAYASKLESALTSNVKLVEDSLAKAAFDAAAPETPFNLSLDEARRVGQAIGCDFLIMVRSAVQRRSSFESEEYYEAYAAVFLVSSRTGRLVSHPVTAELADKPDAALRKLDSSISAAAASLTGQIRSSAKAEIDEKPAPSMEEPPDEASPAAKGFRPPVPFRRLKPDYTTLADQYEVTATVDILVDLDAEGHVTRTAITRWGGYDLDESVDKAVRSMNWRPAQRDGKFVPLRFLVRYNFKKPAKQ